MDYLAIARVHLDCRFVKCSDYSYSEQPTAPAAGSSVPVPVIASDPTIARACLPIVETSDLSA